MLTVRFVSCLLFLQLPKILMPNINIDFDAINFNPNPFDTLNNKIEEMKVGGYALFPQSLAQLAGQVIRRRIHHLAASPHVHHHHQCSIKSACCTVVCEAVCILSIIMALWVGTMNRAPHKYHATAMRSRSQCVRINIHHPTCR